MNARPLPLLAPATPPEVRAPEPARHVAATPFESALAAEHAEPARAEQASPRRDPDDAARADGPDADADRAGDAAKPTARDLHTEDGSMDAAGAGALAAAMATAAGRPRVAPDAPVRGSADAHDRPIPHAPRSRRGSGETPPGPGEERTPPLPGAPARIAPRFPAAAAAAGDATPARPPRDAGSRSSRDGASKDDEHRAGAAVRSGPHAREPSFTPLPAHAGDAPAQPERALTAGAGSPVAAPPTDPAPLAGVVAPARLPRAAAADGAVLRNAAHLRVEAPGVGDLELHLRVRDGVAHLRVDGDAARLVEARAADLGRALAGEGLKLGLEVTPPSSSPGGSSARGDGTAGQDRHQTQQRDDPPARPPHPAPQPRRAPAPQSGTTSRFGVRA